MSARLCDRLDDYLDGDLSPLDKEPFVAHLTKCTPCRIAVQAQQRLANLLSAASCQLEVVPAGLLDRITTPAQPRILQRSAWAAAILAIAAVLLVAVGLSRKPAKSTPEVAVAPVPAPVVPEPPAPVVHVEFPRAREVIVLPQVTTNPRVTILWIYPTTRARAGAEAMAPASPSEPERNAL